MDLRSYLYGSNTRQIVYKSLDAGAMRNRAIAQNLANVSTPDYQRKEITFEEQLRKVMNIKIKGDTTDDKHMPITKSEAIKRLSPKTFKPEDPTLPGEINNVDIDLEAAKMAENQILYSYALKFAGFGKINAAITGNPAS